MPDAAVTEAVDTNSVPKIDDAISVGEDPEFQRRWWRFERGVWIFFVLVLLADVLGAFGRGWLSKAELHQAGSGMDVKYERVMRASTPSVLSVRFRPDAVENGSVRLFVSNNIIKELGNQRISPQPERSTLREDGVEYLFPVAGTSARVEFALEPSFPGVHHFRLQVPGHAEDRATALVMP